MIYDKRERDSIVHANKEKKSATLTDCRMEAKGVTPIPVPIRTACSVRKILEEGAPKGPSM